VFGDCRRFLRSQRSQSLTEFALVAPVLLMMIFGIVDLGRVVYFIATLNQAANEGARVAVRGLPPDYAMPSDVDVQASVRAHAIDVSLANPCANGPIPTNPIPPANQGWLFITEAPVPVAYEASPPPNAPGLGAAGPGQTPPVFGAGCNPVVPAAGNVPLQVTLYYNFVPLTPLIQNLVANRIVLRVYATYLTEY
jgi:Flp pilus assembly protein TadG